MRRGVDKRGQMEDPSPAQQEGGGQGGKGKIGERGGGEEGRRRSTKKKKGSVGNSAERGEHEPSPTN